MRWILALFLAAAPLVAKPDPKITYSTSQASVQDAVQAIAQQAGLKYSWQKSHDQTAPQCQTWVRGLRLNRTPFQKAMQQVLDPVGLRYEVEGDAVVLYRSPAGPLLTYKSGRKSVQNIAAELAQQVGLRYDFDRSLAQTDPACRVFRSVSVKRKSFDETMAKVLSPVRLRYRVENGVVVLYPR